MQYVRCGTSGLLLPQLAFGLWHAFCKDSDPARGRELILTAIELGITHLDTANVYGPPTGLAEQRLGEILRKDLAGRRHELIIATKAGYRAWEGPWGRGGSRKHLIQSAEQSLQRLGLDHVDIFYLHGPDTDTPAIEETAEALADLVRAGKALYVGVSNHDGNQTVEMARALHEARVPLLIHQVENSMLVPFKAADVLPRLPECGAGAIAFAPLAGGRLTEKYLDGIPDDSRAKRSVYMDESAITPEVLNLVKRLHELAQRYGRTLSQLALLWAMHDNSVCSALIGASRPEQLAANCKALGSSPLSAEEVDTIEAMLTDYHGRSVTRQPI